MLSLDTLVLATQRAVLFEATRARSLHFERILKIPTTRLGNTKID